MSKSWLCIVICMGLALASYAQAPVAAFSANRVSGCSPISVSFRDESTGDPKFWSWDFGNGQFSNLQNPTVAYSQPGTYTVSLVVQNGDGTHGITKTDYITVNPSPTANFRANRTIGCLPANIQFTDMSNPQVGNLVSWEWNFGDETTSTDPSPTKTYSEEGFYTVSLKVTSSTGCQATRSIGRYIRVVGGVKPEFDISTPATCRPPFTVNFSNLSSGPGLLNYQWNLGNGNNSSDPTPSTTYTASGNYTITLTATSEYGCSNTIQRPVTINGTGTDFTGPDTICLDAPASFQNASTQAPVSSRWEFGNGSGSDQVNGTSGSYTVPGNYQVKLINTYANCTDSVIKPLYVSPNPLVDLAATNNQACKPPLTANFQDRSPDAVSWSWDFGDGGSSTDQDPVHEYTTGGRFNVSLTITSRRGCVNTVTRANLVRILEPVVRIANAPAGGCLKYTYTPVPNVTALDGVASYEWDFGNGLTGTGQNPGPVTYTAVGEYPLTLKIRTNGGCEESITIARGITVGTPPSVDFMMSKTESCVADLIRFTDQSDNIADEWLWDFGDGETSAGKDPEHRFAKPGTYTVTLTSYYNRCPGMPVSKTIVVKPPVAAFTAHITCEDQQNVTFTNESEVDPAISPVEFVWSFGDPSIPDRTVLSTAAVSVEYAALGSYTVRLTATNGACSNTITQNIELVGEMANFTVNKPVICRGTPTSIIATPNNPASIREYLWALGSAAPVPNRRSISPTLYNPGQYSVTLRITDINGCQSTSTQPIAITVTGPTANFASASRNGCVNADIVFNDLSVSSRPIVNWTFDFRDGTPAASFNAPPFRHAYTDTGTFTLRMTVTDDNGCTHSRSLPQPIRITHPIPGFRSDYTTICPETNIRFTDTSSGEGLTYRWDFGDGGSSTDQHPQYAYHTDDGTYTVKLVARDTYGCADSAIYTNYITVLRPKPAFDIQDTTTICPPLETKFTFRGQDYESFYWDFGDGATSTLTDPTHFYNDYGPYTASLYLIGYGGCVESVGYPVNLYDPNADTKVNFIAPATCDSITIDFELAPPPSTSFTFNFGDGSSDNSQSTTLRHSYRTPNYYAPNIVLRDNQGCQVTVGGHGTIRVVGAPVLFGMDRKRFCDAGTVYFTDYTQQRQDIILSRVWELEPGVTSPDKNPVHQYTAPGTYVVKLSMETQAGCTSEKTDTVRVYRTPDLSIAGDDLACIDETIPLQGMLAVPDTAITWTWDLGGGGNPSSSDQASVRYGSVGNYTVRLEASNLLGCKDDVSKTIEVPPLPVINILGNPTISLGTGINLPVSYGPDIVSYTWTPAATLSCTDCATPFATPKYPTKYRVQVEDANGCVNNGELMVNVLCNELNYFVPNSFSPNGDGRNDIFYPRGKSITRVSSMRIFNRWGEMVFEKRNFNTNDASAGWNGQYKGKPADADVYIYIVEFICENAAIVPFRGDVLLIR